MQPSEAGVDPEAVRVDSYIVRIYIRKAGATPSSGVVEVVASGEKLAFHDRDELWDILVAKGADPAGRPWSAGLQGPPARKRSKGH